MNPPFSNDNDNALSASGRFGRFSYLGWTMLSSIVFMILFAVAASIFGFNFQSENVSLVSLIPMIILYILMLYITFVFTIRRLHDRNHSGWLSLLFLVPLANIVFILYLLFAKGDATTNNYGPPRPTATWEKILAWIYIALIPLAIIAAIALPSYQSSIERSQMQQYQNMQQSQQDQ